MFRGQDRGQIFNQRGIFKRIYLPKLIAKGCVFKEISWSKSIAKRRARYFGEMWVIERYAGFFLKRDREVLYHSGLLENTLMWSIDYFDVGFLIRRNHAQFHFDLLNTTTLRLWAGENVASSPGPSQFFNVGDEATYIGRTYPDMLCCRKVILTKRGHAVFTCVHPFERTKTVVPLPICRPAGYFPTWGQMMKLARQWTVRRPGVN